MDFKKRILNKDTHSVRASQIVIQYGVGAMLDFPDQTLMTAAPEYWSEATEIIQDERLENILGVDCFKIPAGADTIQGKQGVSYVRFPEWYFCPKCRKFQPISKWVKEFQNHSINNEDLYMIKNLKCTKCNKNLVVARIITCCEKGHISDFPWIEWVHYNNTFGKKEICNNPTLKIYTGNTSSEGLEGIRVKCLNCNASASLRGAFDKEIFKELDEKLGLNEFKCKGLHPWRKREKEECNEYPRTMQRGSSSVYFPVTYSSIVIPQFSTRLSEKIIDSISFKRAQEIILDIPIENRKEMLPIMIEKWISNIVNEVGLNREDVKKFLNNKWIINEEEEKDLDKMRYKFEEYDALLGDINDGEPSRDFVVEKMNVEKYRFEFISNVSLVHKIREVQALLGFTRLKPYEVNENTNNEAYVNIKEKNTRWYPAYEVRGEGIFLEIDNNLIENWVHESPQVLTRVDDLNLNYNTSYYGEMKPRIVTPKFILLHTLSHLLIKELSFESGYSVASIKERIYCSDEVSGKAMSGILLYTASGDSEGTLGGLVRQGRSDVLTKVLKKALNNALICSNDPVCILSKGQGRDSLNLAACHSCSLLPETSCEEFNIFLDRGLLIGTFNNRELGFFRNLLFGIENWKTNKKEIKSVINNKKQFVLSDVGTKLNFSIDELYEYIIEDVSKDFEVEKLGSLIKELKKSAFDSKPNNYVRLKTIDDKIKVDVDLLWIKEKVGLCLYDNKKGYISLNNSDWNIFYLDENFNVKYFVNALRSV